MLVTVTVWQLLIGSLPLLVLGVITEGSTPVTWTLSFVEVLLFLALVGTAFASAVWFWLVQHDDVGRLTTFLFVVPILGVGFAAAIDGEPVSLIEGLGLVLTLVGISVIAAAAPFRVDAAEPLVDSADRRGQTVEPSQEA
jgi:drug/metabolite transporter (DMT)-like permease